MAAMSNRSLIVFFLILLAGALFLSGCSSPIPLPPMPGLKRQQKATWKTRTFPIRKNGSAEVRFKSKDDLTGTVIFDKSLYDGFELGNLTFSSGKDTVIKRPRSWVGKLVELSEISWPDGERWILFITDHATDPRLRTMSIFEPRSREIFSMELAFEKNDRGEYLDEVRYRYSWKLTFPEFQKYLKFLEKIRPLYADPLAWGEKIRRTPFADAPAVASVTFALSKDYLLDRIP